MAASPACNSKTINVSENHTLLNVNMTNVTKLSSANFVMWSLQVHALFDGYDLDGYPDGSVVVPSPTITTDGVITTNPAYNLWKRQDRLIYSAILGAISISLQPFLDCNNRGWDLEYLLQHVCEAKLGSLQAVKETTEGY